MSSISTNYIDGILIIITLLWYLIGILYLLQVYKASILTPKSSKIGDHFGSREET